MFRPTGSGITQKTSDIHLKLIFNMAVRYLTVIKKTNNQQANKLIDRINSKKTEGSGFPPCLLAFLTCMLSFFLSINTVIKNLVQYEDNIF